MGISNSERMLLASPTLGRSASSPVHLSVSPVLPPSPFPLSPPPRTYASKYIPIIASVSEHQPPTWTSYFMDIHILAFLAPAGIIVSTWHREQAGMSFLYPSPGSFAQVDLQSQC